MIAKIEGILMKDFVKENDFEGVKSETRVLQIYQPESDDKELVEVKDVPADFKCDYMKPVSLKAIGKAWKNQRGQSGFSLKYFQ